MNAIGQISSYSLGLKPRIRIHAKLVDPPPLAEVVNEAAKFEMAKFVTKERPPKDEDVKPNKPRFGEEC